MTDDSQSTPPGIHPAHYISLNGVDPLPVEGGVPEEALACISVNATELATFMCTPRDLDQMSVQAAQFFNSESEAGAAFRAQQAEQRATDWPFLCRYRDANAALAEADERPEAVFMGDSITEGWI